MVTTTSSVLALASAMLGLSIATPAAAADRCSDLLPPVVRSAVPKRDITPEDLVRLRQIGPLEAVVPAPSALAVSPDGRQLAFVITRADPATNSHCVGLAVVDVAGRSAPRLLDQGGQLALVSNEYRKRIWGIGYPLTITPHWSPDGKSIAWLRRDNDVTQVWVADAASGQARQITHSPVDVEALAWRSDGKTIVYAGRRGQVEERAAFAKEGLSGFHYDTRYVPIMSNKPMPDAAIPWTAYVVSPLTGEEHPASQDEAALLPPDMIGKVEPPPRAATADGRLAETHRSSANPVSPLLLSVHAPGGAPIDCNADACRGSIDSMWWTGDGKALIYLRREGWARGDSALYRWVPGEREPRQLLKTRDLVSNCAMAPDGLVCLYERATAPQRVVRIDPATGAMRDIFDPNPEFLGIRFGQVQRLEWRNDQGAEVRGDLVLPPDYRPGTRLPLIVTTYMSNGFLRGAMGDEYPIHAFAAAGFAVLSFNKPRAVADDNPGLDTIKKVQGDGIRNWAWRREVQSAIDHGVDKVIAMGIADPKRIGISGLSDGSSTVQFAMINSRQFAAASLSTCCLEPWAVNVGYGPAFAAHMQEQGWGALTADDRTFWAPGSIVQSAAGTGTPLLMQVADREYLGGIDVFAALREQHKAADMFVFPDAYHFKYQPAQRLAVYRRNLDWFAFWLQGRIDSDPAKAGQYAHWQELAKEREAAQRPQD